MENKLVRDFLWSAGRGEADSKSIKLYIVTKQSIRWLSCVYSLKYPEVGNY